MPDEQNKVAVLVAEYNALISEVERRSTAEAFLVNLNITGISALIAVIGAKGASMRFLLLVAPFSLALYLLFLDHSLAIQRHRAYITHRLAPVVRHVLDDGRLLAWEERWTGGPIAHSFWQVSVLAVFPGASLASAMVVVAREPASWWAAAAALEAGLVVTCCVAWRRARGQLRIEPLAQP